MAHLSLLSLPTPLASTVSPVSCSPLFSFPRFKDGPAAALEPSHRYGEWVSLGGVRQLAGPGVGVGVGLCCVPHPNNCWVLLQMTRPGPGLPSPPLSGSSCPSTKLRSAAGRGGAADPRPRQSPVPTGGPPFPGHVHTPGNNPLLFSDLFVCGGCVSQGACLSVGQALRWERLGPVSPLVAHLSPPPLLPISASATWSSLHCLSLTPEDTPAISS